MAEQTTKQKYTVVDDFEKLTLKLPALEMNLDDDVWEVSAPPHGHVVVRCFLGSGEPKKIKEEKEGDPNSTYTQVEMELKVEEGEDKGATLFYTLDSRKFRGKEMSTMVAWLVKVYGKEQIQKVKAKLDAITQAALVQKALKKEPVVKVDAEWRGAYQMKDKQGNDVWVNLWNRYEQFPVDPEEPTKRMHVCEVTGKDGLPHEVRAQAKVVRVYHKSEEAMVKARRAVSGGGTQAQAIDLVEEEPTPAPIKSSPPAKGPTVAPAAKAQAKEDEDSLELMEA